MDGEANTAPFGKVAAVTTVPLLREVTLLAVDDVVDDEAYVPVDDADDVDADVDEGTTDDGSPLVECPVVEPPAPPTDGTDPGKAGMSCEASEDM